MKLSTLLAFGVTASAQFVSELSSSGATIFSEKFPGANITYRRVDDLCETTEGVKSFAGYVSLPKDFVPDSGNWGEGVSGNLFFWYFEARNDPENAPTAIYLGGGPGYTTFDGSASFQCVANSDANSTTLNEHSFNNHVNMLYIDQPIGVGFSYYSNTLANGTLDTMTGTFTAYDDEEEERDINWATMNATMSTVGPESVTNTTAAAARTLWRFAQVFFTDFSEHNTTNDELSIWAVSYGGMYAPITASYFLEQNTLIENGEHELENAMTLNMATVGLINALIDIESMALGLLDWAVNNSYGLPAYSEEVYDTALAKLNDPDEGCFALLAKCKAAVAENDPDNEGTNEEVNQVCVGATAACLFTTEIFQTESPYNWFDIGLNAPATLPTEYEAALFNQRWVQEALGVPLNYTRNSNAVQGAFLKMTGDVARYDSSTLAQLLDSGINVAILNGDRDFRCNWLAGQNASLHIPFEDADAFSSAGYKPITTNSSYEGGMVREHGLLSYSRVYQAGHSAGGYQPETVGAIFERAMLRKDVATGKIDLTGVAASNYSTTGENDISGIRQDPPELIENICYVHQPNGTCTEAQLGALINGTAEVKDFVVISPAGTKGERGPTDDDGSNEDDGDSEESGDGEDPGDGDSAAVGLTTSYVLLALTLLIALY